MIMTMRIHPQRKSCIKIRDYAAAVKTCDDDGGDDGGDDEDGDGDGDGDSDG